MTRLATRPRRLDEDGPDPAAYALLPEALAGADPGTHAAGVRRAAASALSDLLLGRRHLPAGRPDILRDSAVPLPRWQTELLAAADPAGVIERAAKLPLDAIALRAEPGRSRAVVAAGGWEPILPGGTIEPGAGDPARVPAPAPAPPARLRHERPVAVETPAGPHPAPHDEARYGEALQAVVRLWQQAAGPELDGRVGALTLARLNLPASARVSQLRVALDMRRGLAAPPAERRVEVNILDVTLSVLEGSRRLLRMAVVVGRPSRATPLPRPSVTAAQLNPPWGVPNATRGRIRCRASAAIRPRWRRAASTSARWSAASGRRWTRVPSTGARSGPSASPYLVCQDSGDEGALGRLKSIVPDGDDIYLHDTPERQVFARPERAFSSGCIRLERPMELLDITLDGTGWDRARIGHTLEARQTVSQALPRPLPVWPPRATAVVEDGAVRLGLDLYGLDAAYLREMDRGPPRVAAGGAPCP